MSRTRVAIVDDDRDTAYALASMLPDHYLASCFLGGQPFLEAFDRVAPDAVLLDLAMPDVGGLEVLRRLREERASDVPVIVISGIGERAFARARALGVVATLQKPIEPAQVLDLLDGSLPSS